MTHDLYLHTLGNLTLTGYNPELSNDSFGKKQPLLEQSHLELNSGFKNLATWGKDQIEKRSNDLAARALDIWHYFGSTAPEEPPLQVIGTTPRCIWILGQRFDTESWRDVLSHTMNTIAELEPEKFDQLLKEFPTFIGRDQTKFRAAHQLTNGAYIEVHMGAQRIARFCEQAIEAIGLTTEDWRVETAQRAAAANA